MVVSVIPVPEAGPKLPYLDKLVHLCEYWLFAWLLVQALRVRPQARRWAWLMATGYGAAIEVVQVCIPWRSGDVMDALANGVGAALGVWLTQQRVHNR